MSGSGGSRTRRTSFSRRSATFATPISTYLLYMMYGLLISKLRIFIYYTIVVLTFFYKIAYESKSQ
ncbi:MAG: hypothetical protein JWQ09_4222 [Segetibacter sp.]|nr:hypothetical protein [Segetibacter sp.]